MKTDVVVVGAGLTGLTLAFLLTRAGKRVLILEKNNRTGGAMATHTMDGYTFEEGPNTGVISNAEVTELFEMLGMVPEIADVSAKKRLILKNNRWYPLPCDAASFFSSPLFSLADKFGIIAEPLLPKGKNPDESVAALARRRLGNSFVDYAVNPFISGIYAGDPEMLVTRFALPKLYNLDQNCGGFIRGAIKKKRSKLSARDKKATREIFSVKNGFANLIGQLEKNIGDENIICSAGNLSVNKNNGQYVVNFMRSGENVSIQAPIVVSTAGSFSLPGLLPFVPESAMACFTGMRYAKVIQVATGLKENTLGQKYKSFGGLIPQKEKRDILGILFPSFCFTERAPDHCTMLAVYMGGVCRADIYNYTDNQIENTVEKELSSLLQITEKDISFMRIFRHSHAIPQYEKNSGQRFEAIRRIEKENPGLIIAGNIRNGIGIADRIKQAFDIAMQINNY